MRGARAITLLAAATVTLGGCGSASRPGAAGASTAAVITTLATPVTTVPLSPPPSVASSPASSPAASSSARAGGAASADARAWRPAHVVVAVLENHAFDEVIGRPDAPFIGGMARDGAVLTQFYAITHPSEPNYLAMFSGSTQGIDSDACPLTFHGPNLAASLLQAGLSFAGYAEGLPAVGSTTCYAGQYGRKHAPWVNWPDLPASINRPFTDFPRNYTTLPTVSFVIPNLDHDMHNGSLAEADSWLQQNLGGYASWAKSHDSLLVITADEDDHSDNNRIPTLVYGSHVVAGQHGERADLYSLLRLIEDLYGLPRLGASAQAAPITGVLRR
jgi:acid phosphatase